MYKITLIGKRDYDFKNEKGERFQGYSYTGFLENGKPIQFSSTNSTYEIQEGAIEYDPKRTIEVALSASIFDGKVKYREIQ